MPGRPGLSENDCWLQIFAANNTEPQSFPSLPEESGVLVGTLVGVLVGAEVGVLVGSFVGVLVAPDPRVLVAAGSGVAVAGTVD